MNGTRPSANGRIVAWLRAPLAWVALSLLLLMAAGTAAVAVELYASTSQPMVLNSR
ncbi:MAG: hypothetical protein NT046_10750 [Arenimonas sp.]|nr:hypothetical protein [Arenimonas sp.]